jgi:hypothetical protein
VNGRELCWQTMASIVARTIAVILLTSAGAALHGSVVVFAGSDDGAEEALRTFMDARVSRQNMVVLGLLADDFVEDRPGDVYRASSPCWYRWEQLDFEPVSPVSALARVRVYEHWYQGDIVAGPPQSWEQTVGLEYTAVGWRVGMLGPRENRRVEVDEPHGLHVSACNVGRA